MSVVVPAPLLLNVPALAKRPALPPKLLLLMSASSRALNVPLFWNSEPGLAPPLELIIRVPPLKLATPLFTSVRPVLLPLPKVFEFVVLMVMPSFAIDRSRAADRAAGPGEQVVEREREIRRGRAGDVFRRLRVSASIVMF